MICCICNCDVSDYIQIFGKCVCEDCERRIVTGKLCAEEYKKAARILSPIKGSSHVSS